MRNPFVWFSVAVALFVPSVVQADIPEHEMDDWEKWFRQCGYMSQAVEVVPELGLEKEFRHLKTDMIDNIVRLGASPEQVSFLADRFDEGQRNALDDGWNDRKEFPKEDREGLKDARKGMLENRTLCVGYGNW